MHSTKTNEKNNRCITDSSPKLSGCEAQNDFDSDSLDLPTIEMKEAWKHTEPLPGQWQSWYLLLIVE